MGWSNSNSWGDGQEGWYKRPAAGGSTPTVTYITSTAPTVASNTATATGASIGTASVDRIVIVCVYDAFANNQTPHTATIDSGGGPVSMTLAGSAQQNGSCCDIFYLLVTSGTTATIAVSDAGGGWSVPRFDILHVKGQSSNTPTGTNTATATSTTTVSTTIATTSGGVIVTAAGNGQGAGTSGSFTGTEVDPGAGTNGRRS